LSPRSEVRRVNLLMAGCKIRRLCARLSLSARGLARAHVARHRLGRRALQRSEGAAHAADTRLATEGREVGGDLRIPRELRHTGAHVPQERRARRPRSIDERRVAQPQQRRERARQGAAERHERRGPRVVLVAHVADERGIVFEHLLDREQADAVGARRVRLVAKR
jgi:hypothetical protein